MALLHITEKHNGKMKGFYSLSTSRRVNPLCIERAKEPDSICSKCYAEVLFKRFDMEQPFVDNAEILTSDIIPTNYLPTLNCLYFRFEAFGDLINKTHAINYFNICKKNPNVQFAIWTKNPQFIKQAIADGHEKPDNLNIIFSSCFIDKEVDKAIVKAYPFIDKVFTVYRKKTAQENNININCGSRKCMDCLRCYKTDHSHVEYINELLK